MSSGLLTYQIHVGLEHQAYDALLGRWDVVERNIKQRDRLVGFAHSMQAGFNEGAGSR